MRSRIHLLSGNSIEKKKKSHIQLRNLHKEYKQKESHIPQARGWRQRFQRMWSQLLDYWHLDHTLLHRMLETARQCMRYMWLVGLRQPLQQEGMTVNLALHRNAASPFVVKELVNNKIMEGISSSYPISICRIPNLIYPPFCWQIPTQVH